MLTNSPVAAVCFIVVTFTVPLLVTFAAASNSPCARAGTRRNIHCAGGGQGTGTRDATGSLHIQDVNRCAGLRTVREFTCHIGRADLELVPLLVSLF